MTMQCDLMTMMTTATGWSADAEGLCNTPQICNIALEKVHNTEMTCKDTQGHHNCCYKICQIKVSLPLSGLLLHLYIASILRWQVFQCTWLPVTLRSTSPLTIKFKSQAACNLQFMCKYTVIKNHYISGVMGITRFNTEKVTYSLTQGHWQLCHSIGHTQFAVSLSF